MTEGSPRKPQDCRDLEDIRREIDRIDRQVVRLLAERQGYVGRAADFKPTRAAVVVPERIEAIVAAMRERAAEHGADPDLMGEIYRDMITRFIAFEEREWDKRGR
ncbi:MAG: chorismate mutase [Acetobacterales bacterium]